MDRAGDERVRKSLSPPDKPERDTCSRCVFVSADSARPERIRTDRGAITAITPGDFLDFGSNKFKIRGESTRSFSLGTGAI